MGTPQKPADLDPNLLKPLRQIDAYVAKGGDPLSFLMGRDAARLSKLVTELENLLPDLVRHLACKSSAQGRNIRNEMSNLAYVLARMQRAAAKGG